MSGIFISYRRDDSAGHTKNLSDRLLQEFGQNQIFQDIRTIAPGENFVDAIDRALAACDILLAMIGPHWATLADDGGRLRIEDPDDFVRLEISTALKRKITVIPATFLNN